MNIVIPMAGRGLRFVDAGYLVPKPLIPVFGSPMFTWALKSLPLDLAQRVIFICLEDHLKSWPLRQAIESRYSFCNPIIIPVSSITEGQACTVLLARTYIDSDEELIVHNGDTYFCSDLRQKLTGATEKAGGIISVFHATDARWSFARIDDRGYVVEVAEKKPISSWATTGMYYFRHGRDFVAKAAEMIRRNERVNNEFYVGPVYNLLIRDGMKITLDIVNEMYCLGTPDELAAFMQQQKRNSAICKLNQVELP